MVVNCKLTKHYPIKCVEVIKLYLEFPFGGVHFKQLLHIFPNSRMLFSSHPDLQRALVVILRS